MGAWYVPDIFVPSEKRISFLLFHDGYLCAACTFRQAYFAPLNPRFKCTISNATAAGVTPEIRLACPTVSGLCWLSFCCTSADKPLTLL